MDELEIVRTERLGPKSWMVEAVKADGEKVICSGKTEAEALRNMIEHLAQPNIAPLLKNFRVAKQRLHELIDQDDYSDSAGEELAEQREQVEAAYRTLRFTWLGQHE